MIHRDGSAKLWDVGESKCLDNVIEGHGQINCCAITTTSEEVTVENVREVNITSFRIPLQLVKHSGLAQIACEQSASIFYHVD